MKHHSSTPQHRSARIIAIGAGFLLPALAAKVARMGAGWIYRGVTRSDPPRNPARADVGWKEALAWTALAGLTGAYSRLIVRRSLPLLGLPAEGYDMEEKTDELA